MIVPKGAIWQDLRNSFLSVVPRDTKIQYSRPRTFREWRSSGFYVVTAATSKRIEIVASQSDLDGVILSEAEYFLDHAAEHQVTIWRQIQDQDWCSSAWLVVTAYYWAFFSALALSRLLGHSVVFLDRESTSVFQQLAPTTSGKTGAGAFHLKCGPIINATERELTFTRGTGRLHDLLWRVLFDRFEASRGISNAEETNQLEYRLYSCFSKAVTRLRAEWPSTVRNAVNYRPGYGYDAVRKLVTLDAAKYLRTSRKYEVQAAIERFERELGASSLAPGADPRPFVRMLLMLSFLLHAIATEAHEDLIERNGLDSRWSVARSKFLRSHGLSIESGIWPW